MAGSEKPLGELYELLYLVFPLMKMYREPFTKFIPLFIFASSVNLAFSLYILKEKISTSLYKITIISSIIFIILNAYPLFTAEAMPVKQWNGAQLGTVAKIPKYWTEIKEYLNDLNLDSKTIIFPRSPYGSTHNWEYGTNVAGNVADYILDTEVIRSPHRDYSPSAKLVSSLYKDMGHYNFEKVLGYLNINFALQENDLEWRYSENVLPPSLSNEQLKDSGLEKFAHFGEFTPDNLSKIPNEEPNPTLKKELEEELLGQPGLVLYKVGDDYLKPKIQASTSSTYADAGVDDLKNLISIDDYNTETALFSGDLDKEDLPTASIEDEYIKATKALPPSLVLSSDWDDTWAWPEPEVSPESAIHYLVLLKESYSKSKITDKLQSLDLSIWLASKRIAEIQYFNPADTIKNKLLNLYYKDISFAIDLVANFPLEERDAEYWGMVKKLSKYIEATEGLISQTPDQSIKNNVLSKHGAFKLWLNNELPRECTSTCYKVQVNQDAEYELLLSKTNEKITSIDIISKANDTHTSLTNEDINNQGEYYYKTKPIELKEGAEYIISAKSEESPNLLISTPWESAEVLGNNETGFQIKKLQDGKSEMGNHVIIEEYIRLKQIPSWQENQTYKITIRYMEGEGKFAYAIVENINNRTGNSESKILVDRKVSRFNSEKVCQGELCTYTYEEVFQSRDNTREAQIILYPISSNPSVPSIQITNIAIEEYMEANLFLRKRNQIEETSKPTISFTQVKPTEYDIEVSNPDNSPYFLVFNESYHPWWEVKYQGRTIAEPNNLSNSFANSWYITPDNVGNSDQYQLTLSFWPQRLLNILLSVSLGTVLLISIVVFRRNNETTD